MTPAERRAATVALPSRRFALLDSASVHGRVILLVDDVVTSGAQAQAARQALLALRGDPRGLHRVRTGDARARRRRRGGAPEGMGMSATPTPSDRPVPYAGIGSRRTPPAVLSAMAALGVALERRGFLLRSGGADGADQAFAARVRTAAIYLPWPSFGPDLPPDLLALVEPEPWAIELAADFHSGWNRLNRPVRLLHARNVHQVLGHGSDRRPSAFVICWTPGRVA